MSSIKNPRIILPKSMIFIIDIVCFLVLFPFFSSLVYQDGSIVVLMFILFIIAVPMALIVGWVVVYTIWAVLDYDDIPHSNYLWLDGMFFGVIISALIGLMISALSIKFSISIGIAGGIAGLLVALSAQKQPALNEE